MATYSSKSIQKEPTQCDEQSSYAGPSTDLEAGWGEELLLVFLIRDHLGHWLT
jgi:hypothetical protein